MKEWNPMDESDRFEIREGKVADMNGQNFSVKGDGKGAYSIISADGKVIEDGLTNREAWRRYDILVGDALNKREDTSAWSFRKYASGE